MTTPPEHASGGPDDRPLEFCEHCDLLGASSVIWADLENNDIINCTICNLKFHFHTEGNRVIVTRIETIRG